MEEKLDQIIWLLKLIYKEVNINCPGFYRKGSAICLMCEYQSECMRECDEYFQNKT